MTRASSEAKRQSNGSISSNQRLVAAGTRALDAHARVRRFAERLGEELDHVTSPHGIPTTDLDPEDSMVIAVEKVIEAALPVRIASEISAPRTSTKLGIVSLPETTAKKL